MANYFGLVISGFISITTQLDTLLRETSNLSDVWCSRVNNGLNKHSVTPVVVSFDAVLDAVYGATAIIVTTLYTTFVSSGILQVKMASLQDVLAGTGEQKPSCMGELVFICDYFRVGVDSARFYFDFIMVELGLINHCITRVEDRITDDGNTNRPYVCKKIATKST